MTARDLTPFFAPRSVAVVGAGERPTSSGGAVLRNLINACYPGRIVPVNPKGGTAFGFDVLPSLSALDRPVDLVVVVIRPDLIPDAVREAAATGHRNLLILPGGFQEAGEAGRARDAELRRIALDAGLTIAGPNCAGIISMDPAAPFAATFLRGLPPGPGRHGVALISQSGSLAEEVVAKANDRAATGTLPLSTVVSVGNGMQLAVEDYLDHLGEQDGIAAILLYIESVSNEQRFRSVARRIAAKKPIVALFGGRTGPGARAAAAHTGGRADADEAVERFCSECGMIRVTSLRRMLLAAKGFGAFPLGIGRRVLVLSNSGGPGVLATDRAVIEGLELPDLPAGMVERLRAVLPGEASVANPIDLLADAREDRYGPAADAVRAAAGAFDALLMIHVVPFMVDAGPVVARLAETAPGLGLPVFHAMMGTLPNRAAWFETMERAGVPMFNDAEAMAECAGLLARYPALRAAAADDGGGTP